MEYIQQYTIGAAIGAVVGFIIGYFLKGGKTTGGYLPIVEKVDNSGNFGILMVANPTNATQVTFKDKPHQANDSGLAAAEYELIGPIVYSTTPPQISRKTRIDPANSTANNGILTTTLTLDLKAGSTYVVRLYVVGEANGDSNCTQQHDYFLITQQ